MFSQGRQAMGQLAIAFSEPSKSSSKSCFPNALAPWPHFLVWVVPALSIWSPKAWKSFGWGSRMRAGPRNWFLAVRFRSCFEGDLIHLWRRSHRPPWARASWHGAPRASPRRQRPFGRTARQGMAVHERTPMFSAEMEQRWRLNLSNACIILQ